MDTMIQHAKIGELREDARSGTAELVAEFERNGVRWPMPLLVVGPAREGAPATIRPPGTVVRGNRRLRAGQVYLEQIAYKLSIAPTQDARRALEKRYRADLEALRAIPIEYCYPINEEELVSLAKGQSHLKAILRALRALVALASLKRG